MLSGPFGRVSRIPVASRPESMRCIAWVPCNHAFGSGRRPRIAGQAIDRPRKHGTHVLLCQRVPLLQVRGQGLHAALAVHAGQGGRALRPAARRRAAPRSGGRSAPAVVRTTVSAASAGRRSGPAAVADLDLRQHQQEALVLQVAVESAARAQQFGAALLEVDEVVRVVQQAHAVRLGVADADRDFAGQRLLMVPSPGR